MKKDYILKIMKCFICAFILVGCTSKLDIEYDSQYGVRYDINKEDDQSFVLVKIDPNNEDVVSMLRIWIDLDENTTIPSDTLAKLSKNANSSTAYLEKAFSSVIYEEKSFFTINLNFYMDNELETSISNEAKDIIEYLGLSEELKDNILYYEKELKESHNFKYKYIIDEGVFINNISLMQLEEYTYPKK